MKGVLGRTTPGRPTRVLTAAGKPIDLAAVRNGSAKRVKTEAWQSSAWEYRDTIGEIRYAVAFLREQAKRVRLFPALAAPDNDEPTPLQDAEGVPPAVLAAAEEALTALTGGTNVWGSLLAPYAECLEVPGEALLVGYEDDTGSDVWEIRSRDAVLQTDEGLRLVDAPGQRDGRLLADDDYVARLWQPHARYPGLADSPMRSILQPCEELQLVSRMIRSTVRSRLAGAGILLIADQLSVKSPSRSGQGADAQDDEDGDFYSQLVRTMTTAIEDEGDASSVVPITAEFPLGAAEDVTKLIHHISLERPIDKDLLERLELAQKRIGIGLDVPPEIITGVADVNHWGAWQIDDATTRQHVSPLVGRMCDGLTAGYLRHALAAMGIDPEWARRIVVWYDIGPLTVRPDRLKDATELWDRNVISNEALMRAGGYDPEADLPTAEELGNRLALARGAMDGSQTEALLRILLGPVFDNLRHIPPGQITVHNGQDAQDAEAAKPAASSTVPALPAGPADTEQDPADAEPADGADDEETPGPTTGLPASAAPQGPVLRAYRRESQRLTALDRTVRDRLTAEAVASVDRALERAANRVRGQAQRNPELRAQVASGRYDVRAVTAALGIDAEQLLDGAFDALRARWDTEGAGAIDAALTVVQSITGERLTAGQMDAARTALGTNLTAGWEWLLQQITAATTAALYEPESDDGLSELGEDPGRRGRLATLIRGAQAIAGGVPPRSAGVTDAGTPVQAGERLGGIGTGDTLNALMRGAGTEIIGYEWVYGISTNHFKPHRDLDGVVFSDFDSELLRNPEDWPHSILGPGDHVGCHCDATPVWADATFSSDDQQAAADATYDPTYLAVMTEIAENDTAAGLTNTSAQRFVAEAHRVATSRPSKRSQ